MNKILVVDRDPVFLEMVEKYLSLQGFVVQSESDPQNAMKRLSNENFDLLITDYQLELSEELEKQLAVLDTTKVIFLTNIDPIIVSRHQHTNILAHIEKRHTFRDLLPQVEKVFR